MSNASSRPAAIHGLSALANKLQEVDNALAAVFDDMHGVIGFSTAVEQSIGPDSLAGVQESGDSALVQLAELIGVVAGMKGQVLRIKETI